MSEMSKQPLASVVIPVYNTAPYLRQCLDSVVNQTLRDIEIICVDDGSTDDSPAILEEYAANDPRITILRQQNQYAGVARNNGMVQASGKYILFCDSDDYIALDALECMVEKSEEDSADICVCAAERYYEHLDLTVSAAGYLKMNRVPDTLPFNRKTNSEYIFSFATIMMFNKMFRREFLVENGLKYDSTRNGEDVYISALALWLAEAITVVDKPLVCYRIDRPDSLVGTLSESAVDPLRAWMRVWDEIGQDLGDAEQSFICKVVGVMRHTFRNISAAQPFVDCFAFAKDMLEKMGVTEQPDGYYYADWYNEFIRRLSNGTEADFMAYMLYSTARSLEAEGARKLNARKALRREKNLRKEQVGTLRKKLAASQSALGTLEKKFDRVSWVYRAEKAILWLPRRIKKAMRGRR